MDPNKKVLLEHGQYIVYDDCLGSGTFGSVYSGYDKEKELPIAVKRITNASIAFSQKEIEVLMKLKEHDNVVRLIGHFQKIGMNWLVTQLLRGLTLDAFMEKNNPDIEIKLELAEQLFEGLKYIHNSDPPISHRDLKPVNILIVRGHQLKLLDFGLARQMEGTMYADTSGGTLAYMAPEIFLFTKYNPFKVDVYSAGLIILAIATFQVGKKMDHLFAPAFGMALGSRMLEEGNGDMLMRRIDGLSSTCQQTMELIQLAKTMVTFQPSSRPDMNSVFRTLTGIMRQDNATCDELDTREMRTTEATPEATSENVLPEARRRAQAGARPKVPSKSKQKKKKDHGIGGDVSTVAHKLAATHIPAGVPRSLSQITSHELGYKASSYVGFGFNNDVLIGHEAKLCLLQFNGKKYTQTWEKKAPGNMKDDFDKAITREREILLQESYNFPTILYSRQLQQQQKFQRSEELLDCSENGEVMYRVATPHGGWRIDMYGLSKGKPSDKKPVMTLRPPAGQRKWSWALSVCRARNRIVVTECWTRSLDIFTSEGKHILHKDLPYKPALSKAVSRCGDGDYVMVGECYPTTVHVYNTRTGKEAATFSREQLGLGENMDIHGLRCCDGVLHIAAGDDDVTSLHAYKVEFSDK